MTGMIHRAKVTNNRNRTPLHHRWILYITGVALLLSCLSGFADETTPAKNATAIKQATQRGSALFYTYGCWQCHKLGDEEPPGMRKELEMGPDLIDVGNRLTSAELLTSILQPNAVIADPKEKHTLDGVSRMPAFQDPLATKDINDIVLFLSQCKSPSAPKLAMAKVTDENFENTIAKTKGLVLLDFWAEWCFACHEINPLLEELAPEFKGRVLFGKIDVEDNPHLTAKLVPDVMFPCLLIMKDGKVLDRKYGVKGVEDPKKHLKDWLKKFLQSEPER